MDDMPNFWLWISGFFIAIETGKSPNFWVSLIWLKRVWDTVDDWGSITTGKPFIVSAHMLQSMSCVPTCFLLSLCSICMIVAWYHNVFFSECIYIYYNMYKLTYNWAVFKTLVGWWLVHGLFKTQQKLGTRIGWWLTRGNYTTRLLTSNWWL